MWYLPAVFTLKIATGVPVCGPCCMLRAGSRNLCPLRLLTAQYGSRDASLSIPNIESPDSSAALPPTTAAAPTSTTMVRRHCGSCRAVTTAATQTGSGTTGPQPATGNEQQVQASGFVLPQGHQSAAIALQEPSTEEERAPDLLDSDRTPKSLLLQVVQRLTRAPPPAAMFEVKELTHRNGRMRFRARLRLPLLEQLPLPTEQEQQQAGDAGEDPREAKVGAMRQ